jgi:homopolymeric O-antigen transport system ATP-binding protein
MVMRLAFAISTCISADIILMDEWLSVGDPAFREKAQLRLRKLLDQAKILLLASNDEGLIQANCNKIMRLDHGRMISFEAVQSRPVSTQQAT